MINPEKALENLLLIVYCGYSLKYIMLVMTLPMFPPMMNNSLSRPANSGSSFIARATFVRGPEKEDPVSWPVVQVVKKYCAISSACPGLGLRFSPQIQFQILNTHSR
jgi:hypothetical protein